MGSYLDEYPHSSRTIMNLAYQNSQEYPELLHEMENTISQRNKSRVHNTMRQFEYLSRHNKCMQKPLYDDDDDYSYSSRCCRRNCPNCNCCSNCCDYQQSCDNEYKFQRNKRFVEDNSNRFMDPCVSDSRIKYGGVRNFSNPRWQLEPRSGEWIKMYDESSDYRDYGVNNYEEPSNYSEKPYPTKLRHNRHRSGSPRRAYEPQNVCTCHHYQSYNRN